MPHDADRDDSQSGGETRRRRGIDEIAWGGSRRSLTHVYDISRATKPLLAVAEERTRDGCGPVLKSHGVLLETTANLTDKQTVKLAELVKYNLRTIRAYLLRVEFQRGRECNVGREVDEPRDAFARGTPDEGCSKYPDPPGADPELISSSRGHFQRRR